MHNRSNVDLFGEFDDQAIWDVLGKINMRKVVAGLRGKVRQTDNNSTVRRVFIRLRVPSSVGNRVSSVSPMGMLIGNLHMSKANTARPRASWQTGFH
jgi:hypothetical protein